MKNRNRLDLLSFFITLVLASTLGSLAVEGEAVRVRHVQGSSHGFVALSTEDGKRLAVGDATSVMHGDRLSSRLTLRFSDGSLDDDTAIFTQHGVFRLISDHHIQRRPSFPHPIDLTVDALHGQVSFRGEDGKITQQHMDIPEDLANGLPPNLLMNILPSTSETRLSYIAWTGKPRLIHVTVKPNGQVPFNIGNLRRKATDFVLHIDLGGITGAIAPIIGKQPQDFHIWILNGAAPAFIREDGQLYEGGPIWRIEQISPTFTK